MANRKYTWQNIKDTRQKYIQIAPTNLKPRLMQVDAKAVTYSKFCSTPIQMLWDETKMTGRHFMHERALVDVRLIQKPPADLPAWDDQFEFQPVEPGREI